MDYAVDFQGGEEADALQDRASEGSAGGFVAWGGVVDSCCVAPVVPTVGVFAVLDHDARM